MVMLPIIKFKIMLTNINTQKEQRSTEKRVMVYPLVFDTENGKQETIENIIEDIRTKSSRGSINNKKELPVAFFSVFCFNGRKKATNVTVHSGLVVIDIDVKDNPETDFEMLYNNLQWNAYTFACFRSPSNGIKLIINTDCTDVNHHEAYFKAIQEYLLKHYTEIHEIDTSGSNVNRACYLPFNPTAYYNQYADIFRVSQDYIDEYHKAHPIKSGNGSSPKPLLQVKYLSYHDHYLNMIDVVNNWTSVGIDMNKKRTSVGMENSMESTSTEPTNGTLVGIYDCIFNKYRYPTLKDSVISTNVPFFEMLFHKYCTPEVVERETRLDEIYFKDYPEKRLSTDDFEGLDGLEVCEVKSLSVIKEGKRGKTLTSICMSLIFNNPFCHPALIAKELQSINYNHCEDPNPKNPAPDEMEINAIVSTCYQKFVSGELDFTKVIRKKKNYKDISKKKVFCSKFHVKMNAKEKHKACTATFSESKRNKNIRRYEDAVSVLQDGRKITINRIAEYMRLSRKQVSRYRNDERYRELIGRIQSKITEYNATLKK